MNPVIFVAVAAAAQQQASVDQPSEQVLVVTATREPVPIEDAPASATVFGGGQLRALAMPLTADVLRLSPGVAVSSTGPKGTQTQVRIRGAEANHSLLFVDGIRFNDPAAGYEARFELLANDALSRVEIVRGPQSALWGSEAIGGVIAVETADARNGSGFSALGEYGSLDTARASARFAQSFGRFGLSGSAGLIRSEGIDSFGNGGDRDGYENKQASLKLVFNPSATSEIGLAGHWIDGKNEYDGLDLINFRRADTMDTTDNRLIALRGWGSVKWQDWSLLVDTSLLDSENRNKLDEAPLNNTFGKRVTAGGQLSRQIGGHHLIAAVEHEIEDFRSEDVLYGGQTDQKRSRHLTAFVGEWRAEWTSAISTDIAVRRDDFNDFADATTFRAALIVRPASRWTVHAAYGEGIARPTFNDLYGFFPGQFAGNPDLTAETSKGLEAGIRWRTKRASVGIAGFSNRLENEIVDTFDPVTFLASTANVDGKSRRRGIEVDVAYHFSGFGDLLINYTYLKAEERKVVGGAQLRELRRPSHSANAVLSGSAGKFDWGASLAYVGKRLDMDFDLFPSPRVTLNDYVLASLKLGYRITPALEAYVRAENAFDARYQDVVGYNTAGRTAYAGLRFRFGD